MLIINNICIHLRSSTTQSAVFLCVLYSCSLDACIMQDAVAFPFLFPHAMPVKIDPWTSTSFLLHYFIMRISLLLDAGVTSVPRLKRSHQSHPSALGQMCFCKCVKIRRPVSCGCSSVQGNIYLSLCFSWFVFSVDFSER